MERHRIALQIQAVVVTFRIEDTRRDPPTMQNFRLRARELFADLDEAVEPYPDMKDALAAAREELDGDERLSPL